MSLAYVQLVVAAVLGLLCSWSAMMVAVTLLLPARSEAAQAALQRSPKRCAALGIAMLLIFAVAIKMSSLPFPGLKLAGVLGLLAVGAVVVLGASGITRVMADRIARLTGDRRGIGAQLGAGLIFSFALMFPILGWWIFLPLSVLFSLGAGAQSILSGFVESRERRAIGIAVNGQEIA